MTTSRIPSPAVPRTVQNDEVRKQAANSGAQKVSAATLTVRESGQGLAEVVTARGGEHDVASIAPPRPNETV